MLFRNVHSEWPKLRPAHLFFLQPPHSSNLFTHPLIHYESQLFQLILLQIHWVWTSGLRQNCVPQSTSLDHYRAFSASVYSTTLVLITMATATDDTLTKVSTEGKSLPWTSL